MHQGLFDLSVKLDCIRTVKSFENDVIVLYKLIKMS